MEHNIITSGDGSSTLRLTRFNETYHSRNGAYTEAQHIYIQNGLQHLYQTTGAQHINIFDVGFGTGLNCILAFVWQQALAAAGLPFPHITYYGIERFPIPPSETEQLNYHTIIAESTNSLPDKYTGKHPEKHTVGSLSGNGLTGDRPADRNSLLFPESIRETFRQMHICPWEENVTIAEEFILHKSCADIATLPASYYSERCFPTQEIHELPEATNSIVSLSATDIPAAIFYDTFSPATQPELWDEAIFRTIASGCTPGSMLLTYCSKGTVKQALRNAGFSLERLSGPPGKRHILRASL